MLDFNNKTLTEFSELIKTDDKMATLYLKNGIYFDNVEVFEKKSDFGKIIKIIKLEQAIITNSGFNNQTVHFTSNETPFYIVSGVAEIIEHFDWYFNNLN